MTRLPSAVVTPATFHLMSGDGPAMPVACLLSYAADDPLAVTARFTMDDASTEWTFARSLLRAGMYEPVGEGDIVIRPGLDDEGHATVYLGLCSPHGVAMLYAHTAEVAAFLDLTQRVVPIGDEFDCIDFDAVVSRLLEAPAV